MDNDFQNENINDWEVELDRIPGGRPSVPEGIHKFVIEDCEIRKSTSSGIPYLNLAITCMAPGHEWDEQKLYHIVSASPAAKWKMGEFLDAIEAPHEGKTTLSQLAVLSIGKRFRGNVKWEMYEGVNRAKISKMLQWEEGDTAAPTGRLDLTSLTSSSKKKEQQLPSDVIGEQEDLPF